MLSGYECTLRANHSLENVFISGNVQEIETGSCLVNVPKDKKVALVGVKDLIIVENDGVLMIVHRTKEQLVRQIAESFD